MTTKAPDFKSRKPPTSSRRDGYLQAKMNALRNWKPPAFTPVGGSPSTCRLRLGER